MKANTPMRAIRAKCLDCVCGQLLEINKCHITGCPLWKYRTGHRPKKTDVVGADFSFENIPDEETIEEDISE